MEIFSLEIEELAKKRELFVNTTKKLLTINLTENTTQLSDISNDILERYPSGLSLSLALYKEYQELSPIVFSRSDSTYSNILSSSLLSVVFKSAQSNKVTYGLSSINFAKTMSEIDILSIIIIGRARKLSYVEINKDNQSILQCEQFRESTYDSFSKVIKKSDNDSVIAIGEAGEKGVVFAAAYSDNYTEIAQGGLGCVMGAINLKGLLISSDNKTEAFSKAILKGFSKASLSSPIIKKLQTEGSASIIDYANKYGYLPTNYFTSRRDPRAEALNAKECNRVFQAYSDPCSSCFINCERCEKDNTSLINFKDILSLGLMNGFFDVEKVQKLKEACMDKGLECSSTGEFLAYLKTLDSPDYTLPQLKGASLNEYIRIIQLIGSKKGIGENIAKGFSAFSSSIICENTPVLFDLRGSDTQSIFYAFREPLPAYADLYCGFTRKFTPEMSAIFALYSRIYTHSLALLGILPFLQVPLYFEKKSKIKFFSKLRVRMMCKSFKIFDIKGKELLKYGIDSMMLFDELSNSDKTIPEYFITTPDEGDDKHTVNYTKLMYFYEAEMSKLVKTLSLEKE